jgi:hypothetical protein
MNSPVRDRTANRDHGGVVIQGAVESRYRAPSNPGPGGKSCDNGSSGACGSRRDLFLDLADQISTHVREGMIKVALVASCHEVRPSR